MTRNWRRQILSTALFVIALVLAAAFFTWTMSDGSHGYQYAPNEANVAKVRNAKMNGDNGKT